MTQHPSSSRPIGASGFTDDDGAPSPRVVAALNALSEGQGSARDVMAAIATSRLLIPVVAVLESADGAVDGLTVEKESSMATVLVEGAHGERAMLAFTSLEAMQLWRHDARPVPVWGIDAAKAALAEDADSLFVDVRGPRPFVIPGDELRALARATDEATLRRLLQEAIAPLTGVVDVRLDTQETARDVVLSVDPDLTEAEYRRLLDEVTHALNQDDRLHLVVSAGLTVRVVAADAPIKPDRTD